MVKSSQTDSELLGAIAQGNERAREQLLMRYDGLVAWHARHAAEHSALYDDYYQEAQLGLVRAIDTYSSTSGVQFNTYATTCMVNALRSFHRKVQRFHDESLFDDSLELATVPDSTTHNAGYDLVYIEEIRRQLAQTLSVLELDVLFYHAEGYRYSEIAEMLSVSQKSAANALARAYAKMKRLPDKQRTDATHE